MPRRVDRLQLAATLRHLGSWHPKRNSNSGRLSEQPQARLWELYEQTEVEYKRRIVKAHPDKGGDANEAAKWNVLWKRARMLFRRLGIGGD